MKIVIDARLYGLENAGIGRYLIHLLEELQKTDKKNKYIVLLRKKYFETARLKKNFTKVLADFSVYGFAEQIKLPFLLYFLSPHVAHFPHFNIPLLWRGRYVVTIHDMTMHTSNATSSTHSPIIFSLKKLCYKWVFGRTILGATRIIVPSKSVLSVIGKSFPNVLQKTKVVYQGFDRKAWSGKHPLHILSPEEVARQPFFVYVGSLYPHKNVGALVKALSIYNKHAQKNINLAVIGAKNVFLNKLLKSIEKVGVAKNVLVLGFVKDTDVSSIMKRSLGLVYPSLSEGFGLQGLEAMSSGTLVLASNIPIFREVYDKHAIYFDPKSPFDIAKKIESVVKLKAGQRRLRIKQARQFIKKYSWHKMAKETLAVYRKALD